MQKWEYIYMIVSYLQTQPRYINGQELKNWKTMPEMWTHLNQLGEQGWELVHIKWNGYNAVTTFKRLKI
jgi:hypothetical protein